MRDSRKPCGERISLLTFGDRFTPIVKPSKCDHHDTRVIEGYARSARGRIDAEVCKGCGEVLHQKIIR